MCDTADKKALLTAVFGALEAYKKNAGVGPAMLRLQAAYDKIAIHEVPIVVNLPPGLKITSKTKIEPGIEVRTSNPSPAGRGAKQARGKPRRGWRVTALAPDGRRLFDGQIEGKRQAIDRWYVACPGLKVPFAKATLYEVSPNAGRAVKVWQCDPHGIWLPVKGGT